MPCFKQITICIYIYIYIYIYIDIQNMFAHLYVHIIYAYLIAANILSCIYTLASVFEAVRYDICDNVSLSILFLPKKKVAARHLK